MKVLSCGTNVSNFSGISDAISPRYIRKNPRSMYARVPHGMAQFVLKKEKLSHIIGTAPILEMARPYGLRPRLWLLFPCKSMFYEKKAGISEAEVAELNNNKKRVAATIIAGGRCNC